MTQNRTALFSRKQAGGLFTIVDLPKIPNDVFFVHSGTGSDAEGYGYNPDSPTATLDAAINLCAASKGDKIYLLPGHAEDIATATAVNCDVIGLDIEGIGKGSLIPTLSSTAAAGSITIGADNVALKNIRLTANYAGGSAKAITVSTGSDYLTLDGVQFRDTGTGSEWLIHVGFDGAHTEPVMKNCSCIGLGGTMTNSILAAGILTNPKFLNNFILVDSSDDVMDFVAAASVNVFVEGNRVYNLDTDTAGYCIRFKSDATGIVCNNVFAYNKNDAEVTSGAAVWWFENYCSNTVGESGKLDPANSAAIP